MVAQLHDEFFACVNLLILYQRLPALFINSNGLLVSYHILFLTLCLYNIFDEAQNVLAIVDTESDEGVQD